MLQYVHTATLGATSNTGCSNPPPFAGRGAASHSLQQPTSAGELTADTLYPYWKDDPKAAISVASTSTSVSLCEGKNPGLGHRKQLGFKELLIYPEVL